MFNKWTKNTLDPEFSMKSIPCGVDIPDLNKRLTQYFIKTYELYEKLFTVIKCEFSYYTTPEPLRHPLIFYYGHTACFFVNKMIDKGIIKDHVNQQFERMFAVGVDQNDWDDLDQSHYSWPSISEVNDFRNHVKKVVLNVIDKNTQQSINQNSQMWAILMAIDHQRLHLQTSAVIIRRLPVEQVTTRQWVKQCPFSKDHPSKVPLNCLKTVPSADFVYDKTMSKATYYGWDSEFGTKHIRTKQFKASKMLVSNAEYLQFFLDNGYKNLDYWTQQGKKWLSSNKVQKPVFWILKNKNNEDFKNFYLKTLIRQIPMPWDWPAEVNNLQARAFCKWKSQKIEKDLRLPTEDQYFALRYLLKADYEDWKYQSVGNINLQFWCSPCPVNLFEIQGFCDIIGNVLQHTITPLYPFQNYKIDPLYQDFTTPSFDGRHDIIKGGCFMNTGNSASMYYRTGFRRHFYLFTGFRYVESSNPQQFVEQNLNQSDQSIKQALKLHFLIKDFYLDKVLKYLQMHTNYLGKRTLVIGCSVGRFPLQLSKYADTSFGTDYTARYFQMAARLSQKGELSYEDVNINLKNINLTSDLLKKVRLYQMNPVNSDKNKINEIDFMIVDGFNLKTGTIKNVIKDSFKLFQNNQKCYAAIIYPIQNNKQNQFQKQLKQIWSQKDCKKIIDIFDVKNSYMGLINEGKVYIIEFFMKKNYSIPRLIY